MQSMRPKRRWRRVLIFAGILVVAYLGVCYMLARMYLGPRPSNPPIPDGAVAAEIAGAAYPIPAWHSKNLASAPVVFVCAHGYGGSRAAWSDLLGDLPKNGYGVVVPALPGHDVSPDQTRGFGVKESDVIVSTVAWVRKQSSVKPKIVLLGVSMGGSSSWLASAKDPSIDAVVTEGAFARLDPVIDSWFDHVIWKGSFFFRPVRWMASGMSGIDPSTINPVDDAAKWKGRPALVIHCAEDTLIPESNATAIAQAAGCDLWKIDGANHAQGIGVAKDEYLARLVAMGRRVTHSEGK
jgi:pimeloyl-ACP methyl ester carboxylesterase